MNGVWDDDRTTYRLERHEYVSGAGQRMLVVLRLWSDVGLTLRWTATALDYEAMSNREVHLSPHENDEKRYPTVEDARDAAVAWAQRAIMQGDLIDFSDENSVLLLRTRQAKM